MSIFGNNIQNSDSDLDFVTEDFMNEYREQVFLDEALRLSDADRAAILESEEFAMLEQKGLVGRRTRVSLSKADDLERRIGMASIQMAKETNDILYTQLVKNRVKERALLAKIDKKYRNKALRIAKADQKEYLKTMPIGIVK